MYKILSLMTLLGGILTTGVALANPTEVNLSINRQQSENYEKFVQRAETLAANTVQQRFKNDRSLEELRVLVVGENEGAIAPVLTVQIDRDNWDRDPSIKRWQNVFPYSKALLGFEQQQAQIEQPTPASEPIPTPQTTTPQDPPSQLIPLPYADEVPATKPQVPLPEQRLRPDRSR